MRAFIAGAVAIAGIVLFTILLTHSLISEASYVILVCVALLVGFGVYAFPRLAEIDLKNLRIILREVKEATQRLEEVKREVAEMYGGIENLRREPFVLDETKQSDLGLGKGIALGSATMRYPAGCIKRERERLARIFVNLDKKTPQEIAEAVLDNSMDDRVFKWSGPETGLDVPPKSAEQRKKEREAEEDKGSEGKG